MPHPIFELAKKDNEKAAADLLASPAADIFRAYLRSQQTMDMYKDGADAVAPALGLKQPVTRKPAANGAVSEAAIVRVAAQKYLASQGVRRTSGEICKALMADGVEIGGKLPGSRVSAHLSADKAVFDNDKNGGGYGLVSWHKQKPIVWPTPKQLSGG